MTCELFLQVHKPLAVAGLDEIMHNGRGGGEAGLDAALTGRRNDLNPI